MFAYQGIVRGGTVQLPDHVDLPSGTKVLVMVPEPTGTIESLLAALAAPERCTREEVDVLDAAVNEGRFPMWALR